MEDLNKFLEKQLNDKYEKELENIHKQIDQDKAVIEEVLDLIDKHILYKKISRSGYPIEYALVTPEMFKHDYLSEPENSYCAKGINFTSTHSKPSYKAILTVNGNDYYDIRYALNRLEKEIEDRQSTVTYLQTDISKARNEIEKLYKSLPNLKKAIIEWQTYQEEHKNDYEVW